MLLPRVIPCLLLAGKGLVKGVNFSRHKYIGDPLNSIRIFNAKEVDEVLFLDISATREKRIPPLDLIQKIANECLMPFSVGGGIKSIEDIQKILNAGSEKVCINSAAMEDWSFVHQASEAFGRQSIIVSVDIKKEGNGSYAVYSHCGTRRLKDKLEDIIQRVEQEGAGEILLNSIDRDGTMRGYDLEIISMVSKMVQVPLIACGGAGCNEHLRDGLIKGKASAVAAGSMFVFHGRRQAVLINFPEENELNKIRTLP